MGHETESETTYVPAIVTTDISDQTMFIFTWTVVVALCQPINIFGVVTNVINIMCFVRQGFNEPVTISLLGLAIADLGCLLTQMFICIFYTLEFNSTNLTFDIQDIVYLTLGAPHLAFSRVSNWITTIITLERCLCITIPLKMKYIVTPIRMWILVSGLYVILLFSGTPVFAVSKLDTKFSLAQNRTLLGLVFGANRHLVESVTYTINSFLLPFIAFIIIIICTVILVVHLRKRTKWLKTTSTTVKSDFSIRDQKVAQMVVMISILFIVCFIPLAACMLTIVFESNYNIGGKFRNVGRIFGFTALLMESLNSSTNIFIYYQMSKKYRETFDVIFGKSNYKI